MSNSLTFEIDLLHIILRNFQGYKDSVEICSNMIFYQNHEKQLIIAGEINEKHALLVSFGLRYNH